MKSLLSSLTAVLLLSAAPVRGDDVARNVVGNWRGTLDAGMVKLRVVFAIAEKAGGGLKADMYSLDQSPNPIAADQVTVTGTTLKIEVPAIRGTYEGTLDAVAATAQGRWTQNGQVLPLQLAKGPAGPVAPATETLAPADAAANQAAAEKAAGTWNGTLVTPQGSLRLRVHISKSASGAATGSMDSMDQGANGIPIGAITLQEGKFRFEARGIGGVYEGTLSADGAALAGRWTQGGRTLPLDLQKAKAE